MADSREAPAIADPAPLGLAAFAMTTFVLSASNAGLVPGQAAPIFLVLALFYGGLAQLLAGMWEFRNRNTFGAVAFTSYGAFWLSIATLVLLEIRGVINFGDASGSAMGLYLLAWTIFTFYMMIGSFRLNGALIAVFVTLELAFLLLTLGAFTGDAMWDQWGGWVGLVCAVCAWYTSAAIVINSVSGGVRMPVWPRRPSQSAATRG